MRVGLLTGGGDCPGLNAVIRAVVRKIHNAQGTTIGIQEGWRGLVDNLTQPLHVHETDELIARGGTILGSSRTNPFKNPDRDIPNVMKTMRKHHLDALVAVGGEDTLGVTNKLYHQHKVAVVGVPKTIDNDLSATDFTFGFDTAINIVVEAVDRLRTTAESHRRVMVIETMGRHTGWIACLSGMAVAADYIMVPEVAVNLDHLFQILQQRRDQGHQYGIVVVSEGAKLPEVGSVTDEAEIDAFGHVRLGGIAEIIAKMIEKELDIETRHMVLGHIQRGGTPTAFDRVLATRLGLKAAELVIKKEFGKMSALRGKDIIAVHLKDAVSKPKELDIQFYLQAQEWFPGAFTESRKIK